MTEFDKLLVTAKRAIEAGDHGRALAAADEAILRDEESAIAYFIAGLSLLQTQQPGLALPYFQKCVSLDPNRPQGWNNLGCCYQERNPEKAYRAFKKAHALEADNIDALSNLVSSASATGRHKEAVEWADVCLTYAPDHPDATYNASFALLHIGRWKEAWQRYAPSLGHHADRKERNYHIDQQTPRLDIEAVSQGDVCVFYGEQGLGDHIIFASMLQHAIDCGVTPIIETNRQLEDLFRRSFPDATVYGTIGDDLCEWPAHTKIDWKMEFGGLGEIAANTPFRRNAYLEPSRALTNAWKAWLETENPKPKLRVGLAWNAGSFATGRAERSVPFALLKPILSLAHEGVQFVNLEYADVREDIEGAPLSNPRLDTRNRNYDDTAALVKALDLVIAPTTAIVDCAGAIGKEVWVMCPKQPPWRYSDHLGEDKMFIYKSATTFRQKDEGWEPVIEAIATKLRKRVELLG